MQEKQRDSTFYDAPPVAKVVAPWQHVGNQGMCIGCLHYLATRACVLVAYANPRLKSQEIIINAA